jgi:2-octaprenylphenol hydroxylase
MEVWDKDSFGHISFDDQSMGFSHLGHIIENAVFIMRCGKRRSAPTSRCWPRRSCSRWRGEKTKHFSACRTADVDRRLVVGADGANSWLRNKADIPLTFWDYRHHALVPPSVPKNRIRRWRVRRSTATAFWRFCR